MKHILSSCSAQILQTTLNLGETVVPLLSSEKRVVDLPIETFEDLLRPNKVTIATPDPSDPKLAQEHQLFLSASPSQLETAAYRYKILGLALPEETIIPARTLQRWRCAFRTAEAIYGHGFVGLIPGQHRQGNHLPRLSQEADQLFEKYIAEHSESTGWATQTHPRSSETGRGFLKCREHGNARACFSWKN